MSLLAFAKILAAVHRSEVIAAYRSHPGLQQRLGTGCRVNLTFGLHCGWAIEGAVGSEFKIDASYLSPNVSIATALEHATHTYGVPFITAQSVIELCGERMASNCRLIDRVIITGRALPIELFTMDLDYMSLTVDEFGPVSMNWTTRMRFKARQFLESEKAFKFDEGNDIVDIFLSDVNIIQMRK